MSRIPTALRLLLLVAGLALLMAACGDDAADDDLDTDGNDNGEAADDDVERGNLTIGSVDFDENVIVASMYAEVLDAAGYDVDRRFQLGTREAVLPALEGGELDIVPDYIGSSVEFIDTGATGDTDETTERLRELLADAGVVVLEPADAENTNALVVTRETADEFGLETTSDLADVSDQMVLGGPPECPERPLCLIGFEDTYGLSFAEFQPLDAGGPVTVGALENGDIDVALLFSTDESIGANDWVVLEDDQDLQPAENIAPLVREASLNDEIEELLNEISAALTTDEITELNRQVRLEGADPEDVAADWVADQGLLP
jgi:osmoprotectant transport system substrate-binding protein